MLATWEDGFADPYLKDATAPFRLPPPLVHMLCPQDARLCIIYIVSTIFSDEGNLHNISCAGPSTDIFNEFILQSSVYRDPVKEILRAIF